MVKELGKPCYTGLSPYPRTGVLELVAIGTGMCVQDATQVYVREALRGFFTEQFGSILGKHLLSWTISPFVAPTVSAVAGTAAAYGVIILGNKIYQYYHPEAPKHQKPAKAMIPPPPERKEKIVDDFVLLGKSDQEELSEFYMIHNCPDTQAEPKSFTYADGLKRLYGFFNASFV